MRSHKVSQKPVEQRVGEGPGRQGRGAQLVWWRAEVEPWEVPNGIRPPGGSAPARNCIQGNMVSSQGWEAVALRACMEV